MERGLSMFALGKLWADRWEFRAWNDEPNAWCARLLTKHIFRRCSYSQNICNSLRMIVRGYQEGVENSRYHPILEIHSSTHLRTRYDCAPLFGECESVYSTQTLRTRLIAQLVPTMMWVLDCWFSTHDDDRCAVWHWHFVRRCPRHPTSLWYHT